MKNFEIDAANNVRVLDSGQVSAPDATFANEQQLRQITADWPLARLVAVWNRLPGATPVKRFVDRQRACARISKAVCALTPCGAPGGATNAPQAKGSRKKASSGRERPTARPGAKKVATGRQGSKKAQVLALLERPDGASLKELMAATGWQAHSVRGFLSGQIGKKMGRKLESFAPGGERHYRLHLSK
jgi:hypothetical protein